MSQGVTAQGGREQELMEPPGELELRGSGGPGRGFWVINDLRFIRGQEQALPTVRAGKLQQNLQESSEAATLLLSSVFWLL